MKKLILFGAILLGAANLYSSDYDVDYDSDSSEEEMPDERRDYLQGLDHTANFSELSEIDMHVVLAAAIAKNDTLLLEAIAPKLLEYLGDGFTEAILSHSMVYGHIEGVKSFLKTKFFEDPKVATRFLNNLVDYHMGEDYQTDLLKILLPRIGEEHRSKFIDDRSKLIDDILYKYIRVPDYDGEGRYNRYAADQSLHDLIDEDKESLRMAFSFLSKTDKIKIGEKIFNLNNDKYKFILAPLMKLLLQTEIDRDTVSAFFESWLLGGYRSHEYYPLISEALKKGDSTISDELKNRLLRNTLRRYVEVDGKVGKLPDVTRDLVAAGAKYDEKYADPENMYSYVGEVMLDFMDGAAEEEKGL